MPFRTVRLQPGVNTEASATLNQTQLAATNLVRYYSGLVQKTGGWQHMSSTPLIGTCRGMYGWSDLIGNAYIACGTEQRLQVLTGGSIIDITPLIATDNFAPAFSTTLLTLSAAANASGGTTVYTGTITGGSANALAGQVFTVAGFDNTMNNGSFICTASTSTTLTLSNPSGVADTHAATAGSSTVSITDTVYQPLPGDWINSITQVSVGGIVLVGFYQVVTVNGTAYTVVAASGATSTVSSSGAVPQFTTANGFSTVTVTFPNHGLLAGGSTNFNISTTLGGVTITGPYVVASVINVNQFTISSSTTATSTVSAFMNSGNAQIEYLLPTGYAVNTPLTGYGVGDYGADDYGLAGSGVVIGRLRQWSMDHWGQDLIASPTGGKIYYWQPPTVAPALVVSSDAPTINAAVFVIPQAQIIVALGAETVGTQNPLLVRCDAGIFTDWTESTTNQAGSYLLSSGTQIVGGSVVGLGALIWTDTDVWYMQYIGYPLVFSFTQIAGSCGLIALRAGADTAGVVQWLSTRGFYTYQAGGGVDAIECPVWDYIFNNIDVAQLDQVFCAVNSLFNEMAWHFPIDPTSPIYDAAAPIAYVKYNLVENAWDVGQSSQYQRTAWVEKNPQSYPAGTDLNGLIQQQEQGYNADGAGMVWSYQTGYFSLMEGEEFVFIDWIVPDFTLDWTGDTPPVISVTLLAIDYPIGLAQGALANPPVPLQDGPYLITTTQPGATLAVPVRIRARQIALLFSGSDLNSFHRIGAVRVRFQGDGRN